MADLQRDVMSEIQLIINTHIAYFKRHPWLLLLFIVGLSLGSALLTAIAGLNQEAKNRHQKSSTLIDSAVSHFIKPPIGQDFIAGSLWLALRKKGFTNTQPVLRGKLTLESGKTLYLQGIDTLAWITKPVTQQTSGQSDNNNLGFAFDTILLDTEHAKKLKLDLAANELQFKTSQRTSKFSLVDSIGMWAVTDLAYADMLLEGQGKLSFIEVVGLKDEQVISVESIIGTHARLVAAQGQDFDALSEAFFFNLAALALLGYIVAAFLSFNAIKLSIAGRKKLISQFNILGCSQNAINVAIILEFTFMSLLTALLGCIAGFLISNSLVFDINRTLMGLYKLDQALTISWQWQTLALGFVMNIVTLALMLLMQTDTLNQKRTGLFYFALVAVLCALSYFYLHAQTEFEALILCFFLLMLFVLITPKCLQRLLSFKNPFQRPLWQWLYADSKLQLQEVRIAIVAILVALGSAIGMQIMVKSFSHTLNAHLEKQLSADMYINIDQFDPALRHRLNNDSDIQRIGIYMAADGYIQNIPAKLASFGSGTLDFSHINLTSGEAVEALHFANNGCLANEQTAIKYGYALGEQIAFKQNQDVFTCRISGFYYDYGNTALGLLVEESTIKSSPLHWQIYGLSVTLNEQITAAALTERLITEYNLNSTDITENKRFKDIAKQLFNDTFKVTKVLNGFILTIALVSLCISLLSLSAQHHKQLTLLNHLGVDVQQLQLMKLVQTSCLVSFTCVFAIPLGFALGFTLLKFVMPIAFGWTIHFNLDLPALLSTCLFLIIAAIICAYLPVKKLTSQLRKRI